MRRNQRDTDHHAHLRPVRRRIERLRTEERCADEKAVHAYNQHQVLHKLAVDPDQKRVVVDDCGHGGEKVRENKSERLHGCLLGLSRRDNDIYMYLRQYTSMDASITLLKKDPRFAKLIKKHGLPTLKRGRNPFQALCRSIIYQQLSTKAAATIYARFIALFGKKFPKPEAVRAVSLEALRSVGLSGQKASYIHDLAEKFSDGTIKPRPLSKMKSSDLVTHLTQIKGIGVWSVHMFLIFSLNRLDILPTGDLGIRKGFQVVYKLRLLPTHEHMERLAKDWREHASVASWYLWKAVDDAKK